MKIRLEGILNLNLERNRRGDGEVSWDISIFIFQITFIFGFTGFLNFYILKPVEQRILPCLIFTLFIPFYHIIALPLFSILLDPNIGDPIFITFGVIYMGGYLFYTWIWYLGYTPKREKIIFFLNPVHWLVLLLSFPVYIIYNCLKNKIQIMKNKIEAMKRWNLKGKIN